jgi:hypothetical protein
LQQRLAQQLGRPAPTTAAWGGNCSVRSSSFRRKPESIGASQPRVYLDTGLRRCDGRRPHFLPHQV